MAYNVDLYEQREQQVLSIRTRTSVDQLPEVLGKAYAEVMMYIDEIEEMAADVPFVAYYNLDMQDLDIEAGFPVSQQLPGKGNIQSNIIPAGKYAEVMYKGAYKAIEPAYKAIMEWFPANNCEALGPAYEFYLNDPTDTDEDDLLTRILMPIKE